MTTYDARRYPYRYPDSWPGDDAGKEYMPSVQRILLGVYGTQKDAVTLLRRLTDAAQAILAADSPDHTVTPTDEQWGELDAAADMAGALLDRLDA